MKYEFRTNAWELVNQHGVKVHHRGGDGVEVLKTVLWVGLCVVGFAVKLCGDF